MYLRREILLFLILFVAALPMMALADDGLLEINQACATGEGCFSGDSPGFPVEITNTGSYVLTSNIDVTVAADPPNTTAIDVSAENVSININGFTIVGPVSCTDTPVTACSGTGSGKGINGERGMVVKNGTVRGMGSDGISLNHEGTVINIRLIENGDFGIFALEHSQLQGVFAYRNAHHGVATWPLALIQDTRVIGNGGSGMVPGEGSLIRDSVANLNGTDGLFIRGESSAIDNVARGNGGHGIGCFNSAAVRGNVLSNNTSGQVAARCTLVSSNICDGAAC